MKHLSLMLVFGISALFAYKSAAQQLLQNNQYFVSKYTLNPAFTGSEESFESFLTYRQNWVGFSDAPTGEVITVNGPVFSTSGVGGLISIDQFGIFQNTRVNLSYAYHLKITENQKIHFGLNAGFLNNRIDFSAATNQNVIDPLIINYRTNEGTSGEAGFGMMYQFKRIYAGISIPNLLETKIRSELDNGKTVYSNARSFRFHVSNTFNLSKDFQLEPIVIVVVPTNNRVFANISALCKYKQQIWAGLFYRDGNTAGVTAGLIYNRYSINYSYEFSSSGPLSQSSGTHEATIGIFIGKSSKIKNEIPFIKSNKPYNQWLNN